MEYFRIKTNQQRLEKDIAAIKNKIPTDKDIEIIGKSPKTISQNNCYNSWISLLCEEQGSTEREFKMDMKVDLGLFADYTVKGKEVTIFTESRDFTKEDWDKVFRYLEDTALFLNVTLPPMKEKTSLKFK